MKIKIVLLCSSMLVVFALAAPSSAETQKGDFGIGLNYPGLGVRYLVSDNTAIEAKVQTEPDILVAGLRLYRNFSSRPYGRLFWGLEGDYVSFKGDVSEGTGFAGEIFFGGEYFVAKRLSLQMDLGPAYIALTDGDTSLSVNGVEMVINFGINYYLGGK
jgi:hypothetical protein